MVLSTVNEQHQHTRAGEAVCQQVQHPLRLLVDSVQILDDYNYCLPQTVAQKNPLDQVERTLTLDPRVHPGVRVGDRPLSPEVRTSTAGYLPGPVRAT
jgi:hypothetical protein